MGPRRKFAKNKCHSAQMSNSPARPSDVLRRYSELLDNDLYVKHVMVQKLLVLCKKFGPQGFETTLVSRLLPFWLQLEGSPDDHLQNDQKTKGLGRVKIENNDIRDILHAAQAEITRLMDEYAGQYNHTQPKQELEQKCAQLSDVRLTLKATESDLEKARVKAIALQQQLKAFEDTIEDDVEKPNEEGSDETGNLPGTSEEAITQDNDLDVVAVTVQPKRLPRGPMFVHERAEDAMQRTFNKDAMVWAMQQSIAETKTESRNNFPHLTPASKTSTTAVFTLSNVPVHVKIQPGKKCDRKDDGPEV
ncbi:hypothetical protein BU23DRAFT_574706 [Bimuria novae-zelandiae CBS 107.79]|uniref:Uncharacterized protein n=1 Tax=Bimuria novae-zelandiae CBS 107.79 TaxID=1447943 RepID=A0A6A5UKB7_9PLEO|nr:hypothetical protein BU23DRAFT_574706 [Bimuria novae-zelandiae CBS 107.79]